MLARARQNKLLDYYISKGAHTWSDVDLMIAQARQQKALDIKTRIAIKSDRARKF